MTMETMVETSTERLTACPLCAAASWRTLTMPGRWIGHEVFDELQGKIGLVRCRGCGLVFINPRPSSSKLHAFYSGNTYTCHESSSSASAASKWDMHLARMATCLPADAPRTLLDYGAGGGGFLLHARQRGWTVRGFEPGRRGLETCRRAGLDVTDNLDALGSGEFNIVSLHHVFEHLANPGEVLNGIRRLLTPQGRLHIEVPNARSLRARLAAPMLSRGFGVDERYRAFPIHLMYYTDGTLRRMLEKSGWTVEDSTTLGLGLDEYFARSDQPTVQPPARSSAAGFPERPRRRFRHAARDAFLNLGLGENLAVIARPRS